MWVGPEGKKTRMVFMVCQSLYNIRKMIFFTNIEVSFLSSRMHVFPTRAASRGAG
jgi:hypothetical protein